MEWRNLRPGTVADLEVSADASTRRAMLTWKSPLDTAVEPTKYYVIKFRQEGNRWKWLNTAFVPARQRWYDAKLPDSGRYRFHVGSLSITGAGTPTQIEVDVPAPGERTLHIDGTPALRPAPPAPPVAKGAWEKILDEPGPARHVVQTYDEPPSRTNAVARWSLGALTGGGGALLVGTPESVAPIRTRLREQGADVAALERSGRLAVLDAQETLRAFTKANAPDAGAFTRVVGQALARVRAACGGTNAEIRAWGEMVNILFERGERPQARALEALWNDLIAKEGIRLLCSYRLDRFDSRTHAATLREICESHACLIPDEDHERFDGALEEALDATLGASRKEVLHRVAVKGAPLATAMPASRKLLMTLHETEPSLGEKVLALTKERCGSPRPN